MPMKNDDVISVLNDLIETCEDGIKGFRVASDAVQSAEARTVFMGRIRLIEQAQSDLEAAVRRLGGEPADRGSIAGAMHRGWLKLEDLAGRDDDAIIAECERGEAAAVERYEDALEKDLPPDIRALVEAQYRGTLQNRERIRALQRGVSGVRPAPGRVVDREAPPPA